MTNEERILRLIFTNDITIEELSQILSEVASFIGEDAHVKWPSGLRISLEGLAQLTENQGEQKTIVQDMLGTLAKYHVEARVVT